MNVQHWLDDVVELDAADDYRSVDCPACALAHFIHCETGKLFGEE